MWVSAQRTAQSEVNSSRRLPDVYKRQGYGLGFERMIMYRTGIQNIRDVLPFPRTADGF